MKFQQILQHKFPENSDMYGKVESAKVCMLYDDSVQEVFSEISFSWAKSIRANTLLVGVSSHYQATMIKLLELDVIEYMNQYILREDFQVRRLQVCIEPR
jgi:hypothetical protein